MMGYTIRDQKVIQSRIVYENFIIISYLPLT